MNATSDSFTKIDAYSHILPQPYFELLKEIVPNKGAVKRWLTIPALWDLEARLRMMDGFPGYQQILILSSPPIENITTPNQAPEVARRANDLMAELQERHPDRFPAWVASLPMNSFDAVIREIERVFKHPGCCGVQIYTNIAGKPIDNPTYRPLFAEMEERDRPIWLHPARTAQVSDYVGEERSEYEIWWTLGWPYETSVAMSRLVFSRIMEKHPRLKVITHHMGGMIPYFEGRIGYGNDQLGARTPGTELGDLVAAMPERPIEYFRRFYADTALFGAEAGTKCGLDFFGLDRVLFASDSPFDPEGGPMYIEKTIDVIDRLGLSSEELERIYNGNIREIAGIG